MKRTTRKTFTLAILLAPALLLAVACQKSASPLQDNSYQSQAARTMSQYTANISNAIATRAPSSQNRDLVLGANGIVYNNGIFGSVGNWNPWGGTPYGGYYLQANTGSTVQTCLGLVQSIPVSADNYQIMVAELARCLNMQVQYQNPLFTAGYRALDSNSQQMWCYNLDGLRPNPYGDLPGGYQVYNTYASQGFINSDLQQ